MTGFRMTGGIDINLEEMKKLPEANYWRSGALWVFKEFQNMFIGNVFIRVDDMLDKFWKDENTWMHICLRAEHMLDLCKALVNKEK